MDRVLDQTVQAAYKIMYLTVIFQLRIYYFIP